jgi:hypothetical protein
MARCLWCNGSDGELRTVTLTQGRERRVVTVHAEHEAALVEWHGRVVSDTPRFVLTMVIAPLAVFAVVGLAAFLSRTLTFVLLGLALIALAAYMWAHPYATPQTVRLVGVRRSIAIVRIAVVPIALGGVVAAIAGLAGYA